MELQAGGGAAQRGAVGRERRGDDYDRAGDVGPDDAEHADELRADEWSFDVHNFGLSQFGVGDAGQH